MREGSLDAPVRFPLGWQEPWFWDEAALEKEMERVFDICHGCRRCFNLCDSFPRLFDLIDNGPTGELDGVPKEKFAEVEELAGPDARPPRRLPAHVNVTGIHGVSPPA